MSVRSKYLPHLSAQDRAEWAFRLARVADEHGNLTVPDGIIAHCGSTRDDVEAFLDELAERGAYRVVRQVGVRQSFFSIRHRPPST